MFGKNYDEEIKRLTETNRAVHNMTGDCIKSINSLRRSFDLLQESVVALAKVQAQHKAFIMFLVEHATIDEDAQEEMLKMVKETRRE